MAAQTNSGSDTTEAEIRRNELRLRLALESAYMISFEWDIRRNEVRRHVSKAPGLPPTPEESPSTFEAVCETVHPDDRQAFVAGTQAALQHPEGRYENEFRIIHPDGSIAWVSESGRVEFDSNGQPVCLIGFSQDITKRKQTEEALLESQRRYAGIIESARDAIITIDAKQRIVLFNAAAEKMFGCTTGEVLGQSIERFIPDRFLQEHHHHIERFADSGAASHRIGNLGMIMGLRANGEEFLVEASISQIGGASDKSLTAILRDISERKHTENLLVENEALLRLFIEHAPASLAMFDRNMCYLAVSNRWKEDFRLSLETRLTGRSHYEIFPEIPERWKEIHQRGLSGERLHADEDFFIREDGTAQWVKWEIIPWERSDGQIGGILVAAEEITDRVQAKKALRESQDDLNRAQAVGQIGSWRINIHTNSLIWSDENYRIFGVPEGTSPLNYEVFINLVHPEDREYVNRKWEAGLRGDEPYDIEHRIIANGQVKWVREKAYLEVDENGELQGGFGITQDITQRKLAELALRESNHCKDEFLAMLAHELRNPLAPISNAVQILRRVQAGNPVVAQTSEMIGRQVKHLVHLVDDLLDVSRVSRGKIKLQKEPVDLSEIIQHAIETSQPLIELRKHRLKVSLPKAAVRLDGDVTRLIQVISNLLNNAAKYTEEGGDISLSLEKQVAAESENGCEAIICVKDNGRGMEPAALKNLFDIFYQIDRNLDRSEGGLGIGLYLVRSLLALHGGEVTAFSEGRGKGSEFVVRLPCLPDAFSLAEQIGTNSSINSAQGKRILLVEDNPDVADSMISLLKIMGHQVMSAADGREAIEAALRERPEFILLDIGLPLMNGYDACRAIRSAGLTDTVIIALTGYGQEEDRQKADDAGFSHHLEKPVDVDALERLLASTENHRSG